MVAYLPLDESELRHIAVKGPLCPMRNEYPAKWALRPPLCPSCAQIMKRVRITSRFGDLPDLYTFECRACGVSHIEAAPFANDHLKTENSRTLATMPDNTASR